MRSANLDGLTLIKTHEQRPNNWGTHAGASRSAADIYGHVLPDTHRQAVGGLDVLLGDASEGDEDEAQNDDEAQAENENKDLSAPE